MSRQYANENACPFCELVEVSVSIEKSQVVAQFQPLSEKKFSSPKRALVTA